MRKDGPAAFEGSRRQGRAKECSGLTETRGHHSSVQCKVLGQTLREDSTGTSTGPEASGRT